MSFGAQLRLARVENYTPSPKLTPALRYNVVTRHAETSEAPGKYGNGILLLPDSLGADKPPKTGHALLRAMKEGYKMGPRGSKQPLDKTASTHFGKGPVWGQS